MTGTVRAALVSVAILGVGLAAVHLEVENTRCGVRVRQLLHERDDRLEKIRRLETRYNLLVSPDVLESRLLEDFGPIEGEEEVAKTSSKTR